MGGSWYFFLEKSGAEVGSDPMVFLRVVVGSPWAWAEGCPHSGVAAHVCGAEGRAGQGWGSGARARQARAGLWGWIQTCCLQMLPF